jgi:hypothetical protein
MSRLNRRSFAGLTAGAMVGAAGSLWAQEPKGDAPKADPAKKEGTPAAGPVEAPFERDYTPPSFKPSWKRPQINRLLVQDFVIYAHTTWRW